MKQKNDKCYCDQIFTVIMFNSGPFHATGVFLLPLENVRKPLVFWSFREVQKESSGMNYVKRLLILKSECNFSDNKNNNGGVIERLSILRNNLGHVRMRQVSH